MSLSHTTNNFPSGETEESVNIKPLRSGWVLVENDSSPNKNGHVVEYRQLGDNPEKPLVLRITRRAANVHHLTEKPHQGKPGTKLTLVMGTDVAVEDSVAGHLKDLNVVAQLALLFDGDYMPNPAIGLDMVLTLVSFLYASVSSGTPDPGNINKLAIGGLEVL
jgi:hypothetical protein